jgi:hypothetical protein
MSQACYATSHWDSESALDALSEVYSSRSSFTYYASRAEEEFERYGGSDIDGPPSKTEVMTTASDMKDPDLVDWDGPGDQENPQNWSLKYKWFTTLICLLMTVNVCVFGVARRILFVLVNDLDRTFASSAPAVASTQIEQHFQVSKEVSYLITTTFLLGYVLGVSTVIFNGRPLNVSKFPANFLGFRK